MEEINNDNIRDLIIDYFDDNRLRRQHPIGTWDVSNVTDMTELFNYIDPHKNHLIKDINNWDVSKVTNMSGMFIGCALFNEPLNNWNVSNVTDMSDMFIGCDEFNQSLNDWNVSNVTSMNGMFSGCNNFNQPLNQWNVGNVTDMDGMFAFCLRFNQPLNQWNVSNVTIMDRMFMSCVSFNQPLNQWNVSNVTGMNHMFYHCNSFNQPLNSWNVNSNVSMIDMFVDSSSFSRDSIVVNNVGTNEHDEEDDDDDWDNDDDEYDHNDPNEQYYEDDWRDAFYNIRHEQEELTNSQLKININEDKGDDFITGESISVFDYLNEDPDNVVFYFKNKVSFLSNKSLMTNAINDKTAIKYGCIRVDTSHKPRRTNLRLDEPYFTLRIIGGYGLVSMSKIQEIINNPDIKCVEISSEPINNLVTTASFYVTFIEQNRLDVTGASHCQEGQKEQVYDLFNIPINSGGKRRSNKRKSHKRKSNKRRTSKRKSHKRKSHKRKSNKRRTNKRIK